MAMLQSQLTFSATQRSTQQKSDGYARQNQARRLFGIEEADEARFTVAHFQHTDRADVHAATSTRAAGGVSGLRFVLAASACAEAIAHAPP